MDDLEQTEPTRFLTDAQWRELASLSNLPDEARESVEERCELARQFYKAEQPAAQQHRRKLIREAAELAGKLARMAVEIGESNVIITNIDVEAEEKLLTELRSFETRMRSRIRNFRSGPVTDGFHLVIKILNWDLLHYVKRPLTLSEKDKGDGFDGLQFAVKVFEFAGWPNRGTGLRSKVRNGIKALLDEMGDWDPEYRPGFDPRRRRAMSEKRDSIGWMFEA